MDLDEQDPFEERSWLAGNRAAYRHLLAEAMKHLGDEVTDEHRATMILHDVEVKLRTLAELLGVEYEVDLHPADVVERFSEAVNELLLQLSGVKP